MTVLPGCHRCGALPAFQWMRLAAAQEADAQRAHIAELQGRTLSDAEIEAKYGPLRESVTGCENHAMGDGREGAELRSLLHAEDCGGHGACCRVETP